MRVTVNAQALRSAIKAGVAGGSGGTVEWIQCARLAARDGTLWVLTSDSAHEVEVPVDARSKETGEVVAHAGMLAGALAGLEGEVKLSLKDGGLVVTDARRKQRSFSIQSLEDGLPFPTIRTDDDTDEVLEWLDPTTTAAAIRGVLYAAGKNDARYYLNTVAILPGRVAACNGHRLATCRLDTGDTPIRDMLVPRGSVQKLLAALESGDADEVEVAAIGRGSDPPRAIQVRGPEHTYTTVLMDGRYPDLKPITPDPESYPSQVTLSADVALAAVKRLMALNPPGSDIKHPGVLIQAAEGELQLAHARASAKDVVECDVQGDPTEIVQLSLPYLADVLAEFRGKAVTWHAGDPGSVQCFTSPESSHHHWIMPQKRQ